MYTLKSAGAQWLSRKANFTIEPINLECSDIFHATQSVTNNACIHAYTCLNMGPLAIMLTLTPWFGVYFCYKYERNTTITKQLLSGELKQRVVDKQPEQMAPPFHLSTARKLSSIPGSRYSYFLLSPSAGPCHEKENSANYHHESRSLAQVSTHCLDIC
eukprot:jgi/Botrbrau1/13620/Bobra.0069s0016.1